MVTKTGHKVYSANMLPPGIEKTEERCDRPLKYQYLEHAERLCMYRAASADNELSSEGATLYCPWFACIDCARAIICAGVKECVGVKGVMELTPERWAASIK